MDAKEVERIRTLPLEAVLEAFGARRDPKDPQRNWRLPGSRISITEQRFYDHHRDIGGGGAIDLTLHLLGANPQQPQRDALRAALQWLSRFDHALDRAAHEPRAPAAMAPNAPPATSARPSPSAAHLPRVRGYLTQQRALDDALVDQALASGEVFADARANVAFRLRDAQGAIVGHELRGTRPTPFHAVLGRKGVFQFGDPVSRQAAFVESGIEALSYRSLHPEVLAISTTGNAVELPLQLGRQLLDRKVEVIAAFNADTAGDRFAARLQAHLGAQVQRDRPRGAKDWNALLQVRAHSHRTHRTNPEPTR